MEDGDEGNMAKLPVATSSGATSVDGTKNTQNLAQRNQERMGSRSSTPPLSVSPPPLSVRPALKSPSSPRGVQFNSVKFSQRVHEEEEKKEEERQAAAEIARKTALLVGAEVPMDTFVAEADVAVTTSSSSTSSSSTYNTAPQSPPSTNSASGAASPPSSPAKTRKNQKKREKRKQKKAALKLQNEESEPGNGENKDSIVRALNTTEPSEPQQVNVQVQSMRNLESKLVKGVNLRKHMRSGSKSADRFLTCEPGMDTISCGTKTFHISEIIEVRSGIDIGPTGMRGTETLRKSGEGKFSLPKSFSLILKDRSIDFTASSEEECAELVEGFNAAIAMKNMSI
jgi:hypothetical protein